jgi:osmotically-inducible protein OsmY
MDMARRDKESRRRDEYGEQGAGPGSFGQESAYRQREEQRGYAEAGYGQGGYGAGSDYGGQAGEGHEQGGYRQARYSQGVPGQGGGYSQGGFQPGYGEAGAGGGQGQGGQAVGGAGIGGYVQGAFGQAGYVQSLGQSLLPRGKGFRGRGPRGYQRSDERINEDVCDRLCDDDDIDAEDIEVVVAAAEVTLNGAVPDRETKRRAEDVAEQVSGVQHVQNNLRIRREGQPTGEGAQPASKKGRGSRPR